MRKKLVSCILVVCMLLTMLPTMAWAEEASPTDIEQTPAPVAEELEEQTPAPVAEQPVATGTDVELSIANGSILITEDGYIQGTYKYDSGSGYSIQNAVYEGSHTGKITINGSNTANNYVIIVKGADQKITLNDVTNTPRATGMPAFVLLSGKATLELKGTNTLKGTNKAAGVQINKDATLTISGDDGKLVVSGAGETPGIGSASSAAGEFAFNPTTKKKDGNYRAGGNLIIEGGKIDATGGDNPAIGGSKNTWFGDITINGGTITATGFSGISTAVTVDTTSGTYGGDITINGGKITAKGTRDKSENWAAIGGGSGSTTVGTGNVTITGGEIVLDISGIASYPNACAIRTKNDFTMTGGTLVEVKKHKNNTATNQIAAETVSITGGNVNGYYLGVNDEGVDSNDRKLAKLYVVDANGVAKAKTEVEVTVNSSTSWKAITDSKGIITTYMLDSDKVNGKEKLPGGWLIGGNCVCDTASLAFVGMAEEVEVGDNATDVIVTVLGECNMPIHKSVTTTVEIDSVTLEGSTTPVANADTYATYDGGKLMLKPAGNAANYTVKLSATRGGANEVPITYEIKALASNIGRELDIKNGRITVVGVADTNNVKYTQGNNIFTIDKDIVVTITGKYYYNTAEINAIHIKDCSPTIVLKDVSLSDAGNPQSKYLSTILIEGTDDTADHIKLLISGENYIGRKVTQANARLYCAIETKNAELTLGCVEGTACSGETCPHKLIVETTDGQNYAALIGSRAWDGGNEPEGFVLNIEGGQIEASVAGQRGTAIGTGSVPAGATPSKEVSINISGGNVKATASAGGTAIGVGSGSSDSVPTTVDVVIKGGTVTAESEGGNVSRSNITLGGGATINNATLPENVEEVVIPGGSVNQIQADDEAGALTLPAGTSVKNEDSSYTVLLDKGSVDSEGALDSETPTATVKTPDNKPVVGNADGTFTIPADSTVNGAKIPAEAGTVTVPTENLDEVKADATGNTTLPAGTVVETETGKTTLFDEGSVDAESGAVTGTTITENKEDGTVTVTDKDGNVTTIAPPAEGEASVTVKPDGTVEVPAGSTVTVTDKTGNETTIIPQNGNATVSTDGAVEVPAGSKVQSSEGEETVLPGTGAVTLPTDKLDEVKEDAESGAVTLPAGTVIETEEGKTTLPDGGSLNTNPEDGDVEIKTDGTAITEKEDGTVEITKGEETTTITPPAEGEASVTVKPDGTVEIPAGSTVNGTEIPAAAGTVTLPADKADEVEVDTDEGTVTLPAGTTINGATIPEGTGTVTLPTDKLDEVQADAETGAVTLPEGTVVETEDGKATTYPDGGSVATDGAITTDGTKITETENGTVIITDENDKITTITPPAEGKDVVVNTDGTVEIPAGSNVNGAVLPEGTDTVTLPAEKVDEVKPGTTAGTVTLPEGTVVENADGTTTTYPNGGSVATDGAITTDGTKVTEKEDGSVEITKGEETTTITPPAEGEEVVVKPDGTVEVPAGSEIQTGDGEPATIPEGTGTVTLPADKVDEVKPGTTEGTVTLPAGTVIETEEGKTTLPDGGSLNTNPEGGDVEIKTEGTTITEKEDGSVEITKGEETTTITPPAEGEEVVVKPDGTVEVPAGSEIQTGDGEPATIPEGTGTVTLPADKLDEVTSGDDGVVQLPAGTVIETEEGKTTLPDGGSVNTEGTVATEGTKITEDATTGTVEITKGEETTTITPPADGGSITVKPDGTVEVPAGSTVEKPDGSSDTITNGGTVDKNGTVTETPVTPPAGDDEDKPVTPPADDEGDKPTPQPPYSGGYYPSYTPSVTPAAPSVDSSSLNNAALAVGSAIKDGSAEFTPVNGYTKDEVLQLQKDGKLRMGIEKTVGYGSVAEKNLAEAAIKSAGGAVSGTSVMYFDITPVLKLDNGTVVAHVTDTEKAITITIELSDELTKAAKDGKDIAVVRVHDGKAEFLSAKLNAAKTKVTFSSADFSTYAVVALNKATSAKTFDAGVAMYVGMAVLAATGSAVVVGKKRK